MKKSVIVLIGVIYFLAIFLVGAIGLKSKVYDEKVYVEKIEILNENATLREDGSYFMKINYLDGPIIIERKLSPDDATDMSVEYIYDTNKTYVNIDNKGVVTFTRAGFITVYVTAKDGSGVVATLVIRAV